MVFSGEPLVRVTAPIVEAQLVETALLNIINHQTLIATKASRVALAAEGDKVMEFGLRRAQGPDAGIYGARAAVIGGCDSTSNVLTGSDVRHSGQRHPCAQLGHVLPGRADRLPRLRRSSSRTPACCWWTPIDVLKQRHAPRHSGLQGAARGRP